MIKLFNLELIIKQPSCIVKSLCLQLVKVYHMILVYLPLTGMIMQLLMLTFVFLFNHGRVFSKLKPLYIRIKITFFELLLQRKLSEYDTLKLFSLAGFLVQVQQFSRLLGKFEVWVSYEAVCNIFDQFFCLILLNEIQSFARLTEYRIYDY